ncbi:hypothetical protein KC622_03495 [Candidatus Dojkabacteria bacterium]|uniref:Uncharacterized protein n=1 Tax=Candidatus Dojkabacteria bacterium TaxID=2099670 RepID=A0A955HZC8_9BACT|nr:hypothetical protein [Candidatus Dojkabacteria bacterium]
MSNPDVYTGRRELHNYSLQEANTIIDSYPIGVLGDMVVDEAWGLVSTLDSFEQTSDFFRLTLLLTSGLGIDLNQLITVEKDGKTGYRLPDRAGCNPDPISIARLLFFIHTDVLLDNMSEELSFMTIGQLAYEKMKKGGQPAVYEFLLDIIENYSGDISDLRESIHMMRVCLRLSQEYSASQAEE